MPKQCPACSAQLPATRSCKHSQAPASMNERPALLPTLRSGHSLNVQPEPEPEPEPEPSSVEAEPPSLRVGATARRSSERKLSLPDAMMICSPTPATSSSEQIQLRFEESPAADDDWSLQSERERERDLASVRSDGSDVSDGARPSLRGTRRSGYARRHRPVDTFQFWCVEEWSTLSRDDDRADSGGFGFAGQARHTLRRRDLLKLLNFNRMELLKPIKPVRQAVVAAARGQGGAAVSASGASIAKKPSSSSSAAARAAGGVGIGTPRPQSSVGASASRSSGGAGIGLLRASGSEDGLSHLARGSGSGGGGGGGDLGKQSAAGRTGSAQHASDPQQLPRGDGGGGGRGGRAQIRDLRLLDCNVASGSHHVGNRNGKPAIWVRHSCILVSLEGFRCAIMRQRLLLFSVPHAETQSSHDGAAGDSRDSRDGGSGGSSSSSSSSSSKAKADNSGSSERGMVGDIMERLRESARAQPTLNGSNSNHHSTGTGSYGFGAAMSSATSSSSATAVGSEAAEEATDPPPWELRAFELILGAHTAPHHTTPHGGPHHTTPHHKHRTTKHHVVTGQQCLSTCLHLRYCPLPNRGRHLAP
eukprot:COSAG06_NODE_2462_length_6835_cov_4.415974_3_plen_589_part_00